MRRLAYLFVGGALCVLALMAGPSFADNGPHVAGAGATPDTCAGCHRIHTGKAARLLKQPQPALCFTCHGAGVTGSRLSVEEGIGYPNDGRGGTPAPLRGGGFAYALINSAAPTGQQATYSNATGTVPVLAAGEAVNSTHTNDGSSVTAWGNGTIGSGAGATVQLRCASCHDPHGNGNFRILRTQPLQSGASPGVAIADTLTKAYTTSNYWAVEDTNAPNFITNIAAWCSNCHTRYLTPETGSGSTDSGDAIYAYRHKSSGTSQGTPLCIQCHVAHGSNATVTGRAAETLWPDDTAAGADSRLLRINNRGTCQMCHDR